MTLRAPITIPVAFVQGLISGQQARGHRCDADLADAGIPEKLLDTPGARLPATQYIALLRGVIRHFDDEGLGFLSRPLKPGSLALIARSTLGARNLEVAIRRAGHTFWLLQDDVILEPLREGSLGGLGLRYKNSSIASSIFLHELLLRVFWRLMAWVAGGRLPAVRFDFAIESPPHVGNYEEIFPASLRFGQPRTAVWFDAAWMRSPVRVDEAGLRAFLADAQSYVVVPWRGDDVVSARVRSHLQLTQPKWPGLAAAACALHMSTATLQRRLASEGTSFQLLKDELRRDIAIVRLNTGDVSLTGLAQDLGFTDSGAFQRAFKTWTGSAPGAYRRRET